MNIDLVGLVGLIFAFSNTLVYQMIAAMVYRTVCIRCREDGTDSDARFDRRTPFPIVFIMVAAQSWAFCSRSRWAQSPQPSPFPCQHF